MGDPTHESSDMKNCRYPNYTAPARAYESSQLRLKELDGVFMVYTGCS